MNTYTGRSSYAHLVNLCATESKRNRISDQRQLNYENEGEKSPYFSISTSSPSTPFSFLIRKSSFSSFFPSQPRPTAVGGLSQIPFLPLLSGLCKSLLNSPHCFFRTTIPFPPPDPPLPRLKQSDDGVKKRVAEWKKGVEGGSVRC